MCSYTLREHDISIKELLTTLRSLEDTKSSREYGLTKEFCETFKTGKTE